MVTSIPAICSGVVLAISDCPKNQCSTSTGLNRGSHDYSSLGIACCSCKFGCHKLNVTSKFRATAEFGYKTEPINKRHTHFTEGHWSWMISDFASVYRKVNCLFPDGIFQQLANIEKKVWHVASLCIPFFICGSTILLLCSDDALASAEVESQNVAFNNDEVELLPIPNVFPPLKDIASPGYEKVVLPNGLRVYLLEDHELGLVGGQVLVKGGSKNDPDEKKGLATIASIVQRSGGSSNYPAETLDRRLEEIAAGIETGSSVSEMSVGFQCLTEDLKEVMSLFSEVVQSPLMPNNKIDFARTQLIGSIKNRGDNPGGIASREFSKVLYGEESAYSREFTEDTLKSIRQEDVIAFHRATFSPASSVLGIWGDFDKDVVKDLISSSFGVWNAASPVDNEKTKGTKVDSLIQLEPGISHHTPDIFIVNKPGLTQGFVRMGELGTTLSDPDVFALDALNNILNGFGGLLFDQVRSKEGLAYSVYGGWNPAVEHRGSFLAGGETQIDNVRRFIGSVERVLQSVLEKPPSEEILRKAKESIVNSFVFNFVDSGTQLSRVMTYDLFGIDQNFIFDYKRKVEQLTCADILVAANAHLHPGAQPIVVVGDASVIRSAVQPLGRKVVELHPNYLP